LKPALLVIDVQKAYFAESPATAQSLKDAIEYINAAIALFRAKGLPVIAVQQVDEEEGVVPGREGFDLPAELDVLPTDLHVHKVYGSAFAKTGLAEELQRLGVDTVILTGFCAEQCVLSTCRGAEEWGLTAILLRGSLASGVAENIRFVESINNVISYGALNKFMECVRPVR
jgi:nicotinamidase-related amidase